jgi:nucleoside-diphosphate-sugar epimerase
MPERVEGTGGIMRIAVTGGGGFVGSHVVELLLERGHEVHCLVTPGKAHPFLEGSRARLYEGSLQDARCQAPYPDTRCLAPFLEGCDAIVHVAGLTRARSEAEFMAVNAGGAVALVEAALAVRGGPRHIVAMSSLAAVGPTAEGRCADEGDELRPLTPYGRSKAAMERALGAYDSSGRFHCTFIRAPGVYGPRDRDFLQYFRLVKRGLRLIAGRRNVMSLLYVETLAETIAAAVLNPAAYGQAFFVADSGEYDWDDFSSMVEAAMGRRTLRVRVPEPAVAAVAFFAERAKPFLRRPPLLDRSKILEIRQHRWVVSTDKARRLLGFEPSISTGDALAETARWYAERGWL